MFKSLKSSKGFTLIELMIVLGITVVLSGVMTSNYFGYQSRQSFDGASDILLSSLRDAQQSSVTQDMESAWGIYINAVDGSNDYYESFYGDSHATGTIGARVALPSDVSFLTPAQGSTLEITFSKFTGLPDIDHVIYLRSERDHSLFNSIELNSVSGLISLVYGLVSPPTIDSISPFFALNNDPINITNLAGSNFQLGPTMKLIKSGQTDIVCTNVVFVSSQKLTGTCDITGKIAGAWTVSVTNTDNQTATLSDGFMISTAGGNVSNYAWSENVGWINFSCGNIGNCDSVNYGVSVDQDTGLFSGYAWGENVGWISFETSDLSGCPSGVCEARITGSSYPKTATGWGRILSTSSWISLSGTAQDESPYSVQLASNGKFSGYSWDSDIIGWLNWGDGVLYNVQVTW
jgi:prepilin-type N-terminal cleavage/methylation domain-containing protein